MKRILERRFGAAWKHDPWDDSDATHAIMLERSRRSHRSVKWFTYVFGVIALVGIVAAGCVGMWYARQVNPVGEAGQVSTFVVKPTDNLESLSIRLQQQGFITNARVFRYYVTDRGGLELVPGEYELRPFTHIGDMLETLRTPPELTYTNVTFPEGYTLQKMAKRLGEKVPRMSAADFELAIADGSIRSTYQPIGVNSLEGMLFPDTYQVSNGESEAQVIDRMVGLMERVGRQENLDSRSRELGYTPYQVLIIASIIEREAKLSEDRPKIARVIYNRLYLGIPLQVDATLYYNQDPDLTFSALKLLDTRYNTYLYPGLPPTPISNPGRASIQAALNPSNNPAQGDPLCTPDLGDFPCLYLYYVLANEEGGHAFAATLVQHEANVERARAAGLL